MNASLHFRSYLWQSIACLLLALTLLSSCGKTLQFTESDFAAKTSPLEVVRNEIPVLIFGHFHKGTMPPNAVVNMTPLLRYEGGQTNGSTITFQGEKGKLNCRTINRKIEETFSIRDVFEYKPEMQRCELFLHFDAKVGKKSIDIPEIKIAEGTIATSTLIQKTVCTANTAMAQDKFRKAISDRQLQLVKKLHHEIYTRRSSLRTTPINGFILTLRHIEEELPIYNFSQYEGLYTAGSVSRFSPADWDTFKKFIEMCNVENGDEMKQVIETARTAEECEEQIAAFGDDYANLISIVMPYIRQNRQNDSRLLIGKNDAEIMRLSINHPENLSADELLYAAAITRNLQVKKNIYAAAVRLFPDDYRPANNIAALAIHEADTAQARTFLEKALEVAPDAPEPNLNAALLEIACNHYKKAIEHLKKATTTDEYNEALGNLQTALGNYKEALTCLADNKSTTTALAHILTHNYQKAEEVLCELPTIDATGNYLLAICAARQNKINQATMLLNDAIKIDRHLKGHVEKDLEFKEIKH